MSLQIYKKDNWQCLALSGAKSATACITSLYVAGENNSDIFLTGGFDPDCQITKFNPPSKFSVIWYILPEVEGSMNLCIHLLTVVHITYTIVRGRICVARMWYFGFWDT